MIGVQMEDVAVTSHRNGGESDAAYGLIWLDIVVEELELFFPTRL